MANKGAKIMASLGLLGILASVIGTGILYFIESRKAEELQKKEVQKIIENMKTQSGTTAKVLTGSTSTGETNSGNLEK